MSSLLHEAARYLLRHFYKPVDPGKVAAWIQRHPRGTIKQLIDRFFKDLHTFHDATTAAEFEDGIPAPRASFYQTRKYTHLYVSDFPGFFRNTKHKKEYTDSITDAIKTANHTKKPLFVDLSRNGGGDDKIMIQPFLRFKPAPGVVKVSRFTSSAGAMLAATLVYDFNFTRVGGKTAKTLSICKNITLSDGTFLGVTKGFYTTPGGTTIPRFYF